jgi:hypothetical protein
MTVVSTKEFNTDQEKYFDMAVNGNVCIQRGENMFYLSFAPVKEQYSEQIILEPDDDLRRAITMDEFLIGVKEDLREIFKKRGKMMVLWTIHHIPLKAFGLHCRKPTVF